MTAARAAAIAALLLAAALGSGCASRQAVPSTADTTRSIVSPPRSARGNPPFYEVLGKRYHVLDSSDGYKERGIASWYGRDFHTLPTSSGEPYDMYAMTAAHKTLPLPTWVEVTNLANGRRVIVRVNDRGPFVDDRIIDLSYSAAEALDMIRDGTARVEVRALGAPRREPVQASTSSRGGFSLISDAAAATVEPPPQPERMFVQVGAFSEHANAARLVDRLQDGGFDNAFIASNAGQDDLHRVRVGPVRDVAEFDRVTDGLRRIGVGGTRLVVDY
ncbi:MAG: septal ring lytic transglycosylase RlpA family protein [Gammaproteobacteria bacterium]|nr:septal ring lytic transglycosylase RlpA family protein [Gammaproteobacteria bacterium]